MNARIALLEDNEVITELLTIALNGAGYRCECFGLVGDLRRFLETQTCDLLILDWSLPDGSAADILTLVRQGLHLATPILIESIDDDEAKMVAAFELGADDYVVKPLRVAEVSARVAALLRRAKGKTTPSLVVGDFVLDVAAGTIRWQGAPIALTKTEFKLAHYFFQHAGELVQRHHLLTRVWGVGPDLDTRKVDALVSRLRTKLQLGPQRGVQLAAVHGFGYRLETVAT